MRKSIKIRIKKKIQHNFLFRDKIIACDFCVHHIYQFLIISQSQISVRVTLQTKPVQNHRFKIYNFLSAAVYAVRKANNWCTQKLGALGHSRDAIKIIISTKLYAVMLLAKSFLCLYVLFILHHHRKASMANMFYRAQSRSPRGVQHFTKAQTHRILDECIYFWACGRDNGPNNENINQRWSLIINRERCYWAHGVSRLHCFPFTFDVGECARWPPRPRYGDARARAITYLSSTRPTNVFSTFIWC